MLHGLHHVASLQRGQGKGSREHEEGQGPRRQAHRVHGTPYIANNFGHGRYFLNEHLAYASSWQLASVEELMQASEVGRVQGD